jgi:hypothetical protein
VEDVLAQTVDVEDQQMGRGSSLRQGWSANLEAVDTRYGRKFVHQAAGGI